MAQGMLPATEGIDWFLAQPTERRREVLRVLADLLYQAHPSSEEVTSAIEAAGLKPSFTPCVLLAAAKSDSQRYRRARQISELPDDEQHKGFLLLMKVFEIADRRRRESQCKGHCQHWWHHIQETS
jgi:hypothetical protein